MRGKFNRRRSLRFCVLAAPPALESARRATPVNFYNRLSALPFTTFKEGK